MTMEFMNIHSYQIDQEIPWTNSLETPAGFLRGVQRRSRDPSVGSQATTERRGLEDVGDVVWKMMEKPWEEIFKWLNKMRNIFKK